MPRGRKPPRRPGSLSRRDFLGLAGAGAAGAALAACGPASGPSPRGGAIQLVYQDWRTDWFPGLAQRMLEQFHAEQPNLQVFYTPDPENVAEQMISDAQAGTAPDVFAGCCDFFPLWAQQGVLLDLRPFVEADLDRATIDDWDEAQYRAFFTSDGLQFALPKYHGALALYYNKDLFDKHVVDYPDGSWTHDDYLQAMKPLTQDADGDRQTDYWGSMLDISWERIQVHVNGWGGHFVDPQDPTLSRMGAPQALAAMGWLRDRMWGDRVMATTLDVQNLETRHAFAQGKLAMVEDGSWALKDILEESDFRIGVAPFPAGPARKVTLATTDGFGIYAGTRYPEAAWELLKFLVSKDYGRAMAEAHFLQPARASLVEEWIRFIRQGYPVQTEEMDLEAFAEGHVQGYSVVAEIFPNMAEARDLARSAWEQIYTLGQAPVEIFTEVSAQIERAQRSQG
jgi:multiple sugar transport system substrate-binding protein